MNGATETSPLFLRKGRVLYITLNRPQRGNSLDLPTLKRLYRGISDGNRDKKIRVIVLTGVGNKDFCTGIDVGAAASMDGTERTELARIAGEIASIIYFGKPVVVGINGRCMGMGVVFTAAADYAVAVKKAEFRMPEVDNGIFPGAACIPIMIRKIGVKFTRRILLRAESFDTENALKMGLIDRSVSDRDELMGALAYEAGVYKKKNPKLSAAVKILTGIAPYMTFQRCRELEDDLITWYGYTDPDFPYSFFKKRVGDVFFNPLGEDNSAGKEDESG